MVRRVFRMKKVLHLLSLSVMIGLGFFSVSESKAATQKSHKHSVSKKHRTKKPPSAKKSVEVKPVELTRVATLKLAPEFRLASRDDSSLNPSLVVSPSQEIENQNRLNREENHYYPPVNQLQPERVASRNRVGIRQL